MRNMTKIKYMLIILLLSLGSVISAQTLGMYIEHHRFLDASRQNILLLDYQIPYRNMVFLAQKGAFFAELLITVNISDQDSLIYSQTITDNVGISNRFDAGSAKKSYLNRLRFALDQGIYDVEFKALDKNSQRAFSWAFKVETLPPEAICSDIELSSRVSADSTAILPKFRRSGMLYQSEPSILFAKEDTDFVNLYFELYTNPATLDESAFFTLSIEKADSLVNELYQDLKPSSATEGITLRIPITDLEPGKYTGYLNAQFGEQSAQKQFTFIVVEMPELNRFLFADPDEEYKLMRYFMGNRLPSDWSGLELATKRRFITNFWDQMAALNQLEPDPTVDLIRKRVDYSNRSFSHFDQGWTTDMGRVYIRNGAPDDIEKDQSSDETRYVRKDFQIWKYGGKTKAVYLFVDIQMSGNYKLLYVKGDDMEISNPNWQKYLGEDFDSARLNY